MAHDAAFLMADYCFRKKDCRLSKNGDPHRVAALFALTVGGSQGNVFLGRLEVRLRFKKENYGV
jgi:hypothetical protein